MAKSRKQRKSQKRHGGGLFDGLLIAIIIDGHEMKAWVSEQLASEIRSLAGASVPGGTQ